MNYILRLRLMFLQRNFINKLSAPKMVRLVKVYFVSHALRWAEDMAAKWCQMVAQCAMQSTDDVVADNSTVNQPSQSIHYLT